MRNRACFVFFFPLRGAVFLKSEQEKRQKTDAEPEAEAAPADVPGPAGANEKEASGAKKLDSEARK